VVALRDAGRSNRLTLGSWSDARATFAVVAVVGVLAIAAQAWIYAGDLTYYEGPPLRSDGVGYYVYLPAVILEHDVTLVRTAARSFGNNPTRIGGVYLVPVHGAPSKTRRPLNDHEVGVAVLELPFFLAGHALAAATGAPRTGFSWPYQAAAAAAGIAYVLVGLAVLASVLRRWFRRSTVVVTLLALTFGGAVFEYATYDATYSHAYAFCLVAVIVRLTIAVRDRPRLGTAVALGTAVGLLGLIRVTNLAIVAFCALVSVESKADLAARARSLLRRLDLLAVGAGVALLVLLPELAYLYRITGRAFVNPYEAWVPPARLELLHPHLIGVLFSVRKGLFFWTPLLLIAVAGLAFLRRTARPLFFATVVYLPLQTWIVASWTYWWYGGSFGMRALIDVMPVFALGLAAIVEVARGARARRALAIAIAVTTLLGVHGMITYWLKAIPYDKTTFGEYLNSFVDYGAHDWVVKD
jgi:hypothetical protein